MILSLPTHIIARYTSLKHSRLCYQLLATYSARQCPIVTETQSCTRQRVPTVQVFVQRKAVNDANTQDDISTKTLVLQWGTIVLKDKGLSD
jgi:hypothetical protein